MLPGGEGTFGPAADVPSMADAQLWLVDAFTEAPFRGNPAGVVALDEDVPTDWMAAVARELGVSDTAFVRRSRSSQGDFELRWFTPAAEVDLCGHATLAGRPLPV